MPAPVRQRAHREMKCGPGSVPGHDHRETPETQGQQKVSFRCEDRRKK